MPDVFIYLFNGGFYNAILGYNVNFLDGLDIGGFNNMVMELHRTVEISSKLWDYIFDKKNKDGKATNRLMAHLGLDNPHQVKNRTFEEWKIIVDKFLQFQSILKNPKGKRE